MCGCLGWSGGEVVGEFFRTTDRILCIGIYSVLKHYPHFYGLKISLMPHSIVWQMV